MAKNDLTDYAVINESTGEYQGFMTVDEANVYFKSRTSAPRMNNKTAIKYTGNITKDFINENLGSFYFNYYDKTGEYEQLFRFLYLSTYANYKNYIELGNSSERLADKKDLQEILMLENKQFYNTFNYFISNNLLIEENYYVNDEIKKCYKINDSLCIRGQINKNNASARMFDEGVRYIYKHSNSKEHKKLGYLIKLLPYTHKQTNIICEDVNCSVGDIKPLSQKQILEILNITKPTLTSLTKIKILDNEESAFIKISNAFISKAYVINPRLTYKGSDINELESTLNLFKAGNNK